MSTDMHAAKRQFKEYSFSVTQAVKQQMLDWGNRFSICCFMDNHGYSSQYTSFECLLAAGEWKSVSLAAGNAFASLQSFSLQYPDWLFGHFGFDLKLETENVSSMLPDPLSFPDGFFFVPEHLVLITQAGIRISSYSMDPDLLLQEVLDMPLFSDPNPRAVQLNPSISRGEYISKIEALKAHIHRGDCYEINFCQEFAASGVSIDPLQVYRRLCAVSPNPFAVYYKLHELYLLCASPERYLRIDGRTVRSQPIKGTAARDLQSIANDDALARSLSESSKERSENVMVVDLVRNDLARICAPGTVEVEELFGVYRFPQVHQLISTVKGELAEGLNWIDAVKASFPMGSMTGAPKKKVLELIEQYESVRRGIFSGAVGYCTPGGDADFNVVIRSLMYNNSRRYLSCLVGSGITWYADPAKEYEECLLKAAAIKKALE